MTTQIETTTASNVVLKDVQTEAATSATKSFNPQQALQRLEADRIKWQEGVYRTSNLALYALLASCLTYAGELPFAEAKQRSAALEAFYKEREYTYKSDTPLMTRIVRAVFGDIDRRRTSTYSVVLRQAQKEGVFPQNLSEWIESKGGIQMVKLSQSSTYIKPVEKAASAKNDFDMLVNLAIVKSDQLGLHAEPDYMGQNCVLLAQQQADGGFAIRAVLRSNGTLNAAFTELYSKTTNDKASAKKELNAANDASGLPKAA